MSKDLEGQELKQSFKENILYALKKSKNAAIKITFVFSGTHQGAKFRYKENITCFAGDFTYKNVYLSQRTIDKDIIINIIVDNLSYDCFSFIECKEKIGEVECHGFGDYWGEDKFVFIYERLNNFL